MLAMLLGGILLDENAMREEFVERLNQIQCNECVTTTEEQVRAILGPPTKIEAIQNGGEKLVVWKYATPGANAYPDLATVILRNSRINSGAYTHAVSGRGEVSYLQRGDLDIVIELYDAASCDGEVVKMGSLMRIARQLISMPRMRSGAILREFLRTEPALLDAEAMDTPGPYHHAGRFVLIRLALSDVTATNLYRDHDMNAQIGIIEGWPAVISTRLAPKGSGTTEHEDWVESWEKGLPSRRNFGAPFDLDHQVATIARANGVPEQGLTSYVRMVREQIAR